MSTPDFLQTLRLRSAVLQSIRAFFLERDFVEVETPVRVAAPAPELHIDLEECGNAYLRPSPELEMKRLLARGAERIFQMGPCFRRGERGRQHHPEYTMLEWYRADADYLDMIVDVKALVLHVCETTAGTLRLPFRGSWIEMAPLWDCLSVRDAFLAFAGWDPLGDYDEDRFDVDLVQKVEPNLSVERPVILKDYPAARASLARCRKDDASVAERWELYLGGMEIANAFSELTDPIEQRRRFEAWSEQRGASGKPVWPFDARFLAAMEEGLPESAGVALGVDRLIMILAGAETIEQVRPFAEDVL